MNTILPPGTSESLRQITGVNPLRVSPLHGGCVGEVYRVDLPEENAMGVNTLALKIDPSDSARLEVEGRMLQYLAHHTSLPVPTVYHKGAQLLAMAFLPGESRFNAMAETHAAELLAELHQVTAPKFGFEEETLLGGLVQENPWTDRWLDFFAEHRILAMTRQAQNRGLITPTLANRLETFCNRLNEWLEEPQAPALLHGDAWTTNMLASGNRITGFLDPAIYYGHPEIELAFTTLFNTFDKPFFNRYQELSPIPPGFFELRRDLYNLYPLLAHVNIFGGGYIAPIEQTLKKIGC